MDVLGNKVSRDETAADHICHFQHIWVKRQVQLECSEADHVIRHDGQGNRIIHLRRYRRWFNAHNRSALGLGRRSHKGNNADHQDKPTPKRE